MNLIPDIIALLGVVIIAILIYLITKGKRNAMKLTPDERLYEIDRWLSAGVIMTKEYADNLKAHIDKVALMPGIDAGKLAIVRGKFDRIFSKLYDKSLIVKEKGVPLRKDYSNQDEIDLNFMNTCNY